MIFLCVVLLLFMLFFTYLLNGYEVLSITFIGISMFLLSIFVVIMNLGKWQFKMSSETCMIILSGMLSFMIGEIVAKQLYGRNLYAKKGEKIISYYVPDNFFYGTIIFLLIADYLYLDNVLGISKTGSIGSLLRSYRRLMVAGEYSLPDTINLFNNIGYCLAVVYIFVFINSKRHEKKYLIPVVLYLFNLVISSGRARIIHILAAAIVWVYFRMSNRISSLGQKRAIGIKIIKYGCIAIVSYLVIFYLLGKLTEKSSLYTNVFENFSMYIGSSICALDDFLKKYNGVSDIDSRGEIFLGVILLLRRFGVNIRGIKNNYLPYVYFPWMNHTTNVYTCFRREIHDIGVGGMMLLNLFLGFLYSKIFYKIYKNKYKNSELVKLLFGVFYYPVVLMSIDFRFFDIISLTSIIEITCICVIFKKFVHAKENGVI